MEGDTDQEAVGRFVGRYAGPPSAADESSRSSFREDTVIREVNSLLDQRGDQVVRVVDACCGYGVLAAHLRRGLGDGAKNVGYRAFDQSMECVKRVRASHERGGFHEFDAKLAEVWEPPAAWGETADLVVLSNVLHELPASRFPELFAALNRLLVPRKGRICIIDMEELPPNEPEAIAVNWSRTEVEQFLTAGGLNVSATTHTKAVDVFCVVVNHLPTELKRDAMLSELARLLRAKATVVVEERAAMPEGFHTDAERLTKWVVQTGSIARLAEELLAVEKAVVPAVPAR